MAAPFNNIIIFKQPLLSSRHRVNNLLKTHYDLDIETALVPIFHTKKLKHRVVQ